MIHPDQSYDHEMVIPPKAGFDQSLRAEVEKDGEECWAVSCDVDDVDYEISMWPQNLGARREWRRSEKDWLSMVSR